MKYIKYFMLIACGSYLRVHCKQTHCPMRNHLIHNEPVVQTAAEIVIELLNNEITNKEALLTEKLEERNALLEERKALLEENRALKAQQKQADDAENNVKLSH